MISSGRGPGHRQHQKDDCKGLGAGKGSSVHCLLLCASPLMFGSLSLLAQHFPRPLTLLFCPLTPSFTFALRFGLGKGDQVALTEMEGLLEDPSGNTILLPATISI